MKIRNLVLSLSLLISSTTKADEVKIGAILPLSGDFAFAGQGFREGIDEAIKEYPNIPFKVIYEDDESLNKLKTVTAFQKLSSIDGVSIVFTAAVNSTAAAASLANRAKLPTLIVWDANEQIKGMGPSIFGIGVETEGTGQDVARTVVKKRKRTKIAILSVQDEWSQIISEAFAKEAKHLGAEIVLNENFSLGERDFRSALNRAILMEADAIYYPVFADSLISITRQAKELQFKGDLVTGDSLSENEIKALGTFAEGVICAQVWLGREEQEKDISTSIHKGFVHLGKRAVHMSALAAQSLVANGKAITRANLHAEFTTLLKGKNEARARIGNSAKTGEFRETILQVVNGRLKPI